MARPINTSIPDPQAGPKARFSPSEVVPDDRQIRRMFQRTLATWTMDLLNRPAGLKWQDADPHDDYRSPDWRSLYDGNILDD